MRILKFAFWLSAVVIFLPASNDNEPTRQADATPAASQYMAATNIANTAMSVVSKAGDLADFCAHQPTICATSMAALKVAKEFDLSASAPQESALPAAPLAATGRDRLVAGSTGKAKHNTLKLEDLIPVWTAPTGTTRS